MFGLRRFVTRFLARRGVRRGLGFVLVGVALLLLVRWFILPGYDYSWTGFGEHATPDGQVQRSKTLWDWLELVLLPTALILSALFFNWSTQDRADQRFEQQIQREDRRATEQLVISREMDDNRLREEALQTYLDRMSELVLDWRLRNTGLEEDVRDAARTRTFALLRLLADDATRKAVVLQFLYESELIQLEQDPRSGTVAPSVVDLYGADLRIANLRQVTLRMANLSKANLFGADLFGANLIGAKLSGADLIEADLREADLRMADLCGADLSGANLRAANLERAHLSNADLTGAILLVAHLRGADLRDAILEQASLRDAMLEGVNLSGANLTGADLRWADLRDANLRRAGLTGADLRVANLAGADLRGAVVTPAQIAQARVLTGAILPDGTRVK